MSKINIYQVLPRLFGNYNSNNKTSGTINENGCGKFNDFNEKALKEIKLLGISHIWYTGVLEHATCSDYSFYGIKRHHPTIIKGLAGSPYAIVDYYDVSPDLAVDVNNRMQEFEALIERTHTAGLKLIIDFVPNHVAREYSSDNLPAGITDLGENDNTEWAFSPLNNFYYIPNKTFSPHFELEGYVEHPAKATGNDVFYESPSKNDWYETIKLNYGLNYLEGKQKQFDPIPDTWIKMLDIVLFWASKKIDGLRCDMAEMVPVEFWAWMIPKVKKEYPNLIFIAEVYQPSEYRNYLFHGKFDYLYDKVGLYDTLRAVSCGYASAHSITNCWQALGAIQDKMLNFLENHDEQRIASGFFCGNPIAAKAPMIVSSCLSKGPFMLYFGQELGELGMDLEGFSGIDGRTSIFDYWGVKSVQAWANNGKFDGKALSSEEKDLRNFYKSLLNITKKEKAISQGLMFDLEYANFDNEFFNTEREYTFLRKYKNELLLIVVNFSARELETEINIPKEAFEYLEIEENSLFSCKNLLDKSEKPIEVELSATNRFKTTVPVWSGNIYKLQAISGK